MTKESTMSDSFNERTKKERRYKILSVGIDIIFDLLYPIGNKNIISRIKLPEDVHPITVRYSQDRQSFLFLLESESFPHVEPGMEIPYLKGDYWCVARNQVMTDETVIKKYLEDLNND